MGTIYLKMFINRLNLKYEIVPDYDIMYTNRQISLQSNYFNRHKKGPYYNGKSHSVNAAIYADKGAT